MFLDPLATKAWLALLYSGLDRFLTVTIKGWTTAYKDVSNDSYTPDVDLRIVCFVAENLRCHVDWTAYLFLELLALLELRRETEISNLDVQRVRSILQENILWLEVPMKEVLLVHVINRLQSLLDHRGGLSLCQSVMSVHKVGQVTPSHEL